MKSLATKQTTLNCYGGDILESIENIVNLLETFGVQVKTSNGDYRPTYDVLLDISKVLSGKKNK